MFMLRKTASHRKHESGWHKSCIQRFFATAELPEIAIDEAAFEALATESTNKGYTVPGVQRKLSLHLFSEGDTPRLTLVNYPTGYILKRRFRNLKRCRRLNTLLCAWRIPQDFHRTSCAHHGKRQSGIHHKKSGPHIYEKQYADAGDGGFLSA